MQSSEDPQLAEKIQADTAHSARVWNYLLGGRDNYRPDRDVGDMILKLFPGIARVARLQRRQSARWRAASESARRSGGSPTERGQS